MARIRTIKPGFFLNDDLAQLGPYAQLLFAGLWCLADKDGRLEDRPLRIKAEVLPYYDVNPDELLAGLAIAGFIERYEIGGQKCIQIATFSEHQRITGSESESVSRFPGPPEKQNGNTEETPGKPNGNNRVRSRKGREGKGDNPPLPPKGDVDEILSTLTQSQRIAWDEWVAYRKQRKLPAYVPVGLKRTVDAWLRHPNPEESIRFSIEKNYQGIYAPKTEASPPAKPDPYAHLKSLSDEDRARIAG